MTSQNCLGCVMAKEVNVKGKEVVPTSPKGCRAQSFLPSQHLPPQRAALRDAA